ncbi:MAG: hypothetical protein LQ342_006002 [Letrouitia transgressa]|nr:MAG: hypothetical protein LQ342_006002 [Letrouitia transgressa]
MSPPSSPTPSERSRADAAARAKQAEEQSRLPYKWTQTIRDVDVLVPVLPHLRGRDIDASITKTHLRIGIKGQPPVIDGPLTHSVLVDESAWTLETVGDGKGKEVNVHLDKSNKMEWWDAVVQNAEYKIDTSKIVPEDSKLGDLDGETRGMVEKMMYVWDCFLPPSILLICLAALFCSPRTVYWLQSFQFKRAPQGFKRE